MYINDVHEIEKVTSTIFRKTKNSIKNTVFQILYFSCPFFGEKNKILIWSWEMKTKEIDKL